MDSVEKTGSRQSTERNVGRLPEWLRRPAGSSAQTAALKRMLRKTQLNTVCEDARCPNIAECFGRKTATFMILGDVCTRGCRFCSITTGKPHFSPDAFLEEAEGVAQAALDLGLKHVVVTSVARDDLADGGAAGFGHTIRAIRARLPQATIEVLIPDFRGDRNALESVADAGPDVINHNIETVPRLYRRVRPGSSYIRSLELLRDVKSAFPDISTKTGIMLGLGENRDEILEVLNDCRSHSIDIFTAGQYMQPTRSHLPVERYVEPQEFDDLREYANTLGFSAVFMGPLVRSSYHAGEVFESVTPRQN